MDRSLMFLIEIYLNHECPNGSIVDNKNHYLSAWLV